MCGFSTLVLLLTMEVRTQESVTVVYIPFHRPLTTVHSLLEVTHTMEITVDP